MSDIETGALTILGWREWARLPDLGIKRIKTKIDTGAHSSALHAFEIEMEEREHEQWVRFTIQPFQNKAFPRLEACARVHEFREVRSSNGETTTRPVIRTPVELSGHRYNIDVTLFDRSKMSFRMLIGREALRGRFLVDSNQSFCGGKPKSSLNQRNEG